jgi:predicted amidophosphoribosyltransferase
MGAVAPLARTLDQELLALLRGASLECLVCGEFVQHHAGGAITCPECGLELRHEEAATGALDFSVQAG